ncbi:transcriptional regulator [Rhizobium sp. S152]|uniref:transcriptional regulator n=1 Tax=Rhizobium sp. S152 TaxID=3055038 RepID=UPI0025A95EB2|nr:transcriptional regulator [Rhizobium sp. S152]MDM9627771.1 transcriptional regulator [Rhizobium sp. S152]
MNAFLDFEASSLGRHGYPIEIAWVFEDDRSRSLLIKPEPTWTDWSEDAQAIHGISRQQLDQEGTPVILVVTEMMAELAGHDLYASSPSWDGKWLSVLLRGGGVPRHMLRVRKSDDLFQDIASQIIGASPNFSRGGVGAVHVDISALVAEVIARSEPDSLAHRALPDAQLELERLRLVREAAQRRLV